MTRAASSRRIAFAATGVAAIALAGSRLATYTPAVAASLHRAGPWAPVAFILAYVFACVAAIPASVLTLVAGTLFGIVRGTLYVLIAATIGAIGAFLLARYAARGAIERRLVRHVRFVAIDYAVEREGFKIATLLRLSPLVPFSLLNYALGLTPIRLRDYALAMIGIVPGTLLCVYYGRVTGDIATIAMGTQPSRGVVGTLVLVAGGIATAGVTYVVTRAARRAVRGLTDGLTV
jgi:uncharacterized membrane protein YdjX (TVP38/TMEM64 family)